MRHHVESLLLWAALLASLSAEARRGGHHSQTASDAHTAAAIGVTLYKQADYATALDAFERAYLLSGDAAWASRSAGLVAGAAVALAA